MSELYLDYCSIGFDEKGVLNRFEPKPTHNFNFGYDVLDVIGKKQPQKTAVVWCNQRGEERRLTFSELSSLSNQAANVFLSHGIKKGDKVMLILKRHYQFWYILPALHKIGAIAIPATNLLTKKDLEYRFNSAGVKAVVCTGEGEVAEQVMAALPNSKTVEKMFMVPGKNEKFIDFENEMQEASDKLERIETKVDETMILYFTSGTTGQPKMVVHNYSYPIGHIITAKFWHNAKEDGLHFTLAETGWAKAVWGKIYGQWFVKAAVFVYDFDRFAAGDILHMIEKYKITTFCAPPTIFRFFIKEGLEGYDLGSLEYATIAGEALNPEVFNKFHELTGIRLMEGFGQTETTLLAANLVGSTPKPCSMGRPSPLYQIMVVDENGKEVPKGEVGEIVVKAEKAMQVGMFDEYYLDSEKTNEVWHDGLYHTGDTAWSDEDGYLWYVGRTDDMIKTSGYRIGPFEIESVIIEHPAVLECAVTGEPDAIRGMVIKATIVLMKNYTPSEELKKDIQEYVKKQTAPYKYPRIIHFVSEIPKTISGKIRRVELKGKKENN